MVTAVERQLGVVVERFEGLIPQGPTLWALVSQHLDSSRQAECRGMTDDRVLLVS
jgi:hypothetical protein